MRTTFNLILWTLCWILGAGSTSVLWAQTFQIVPRDQSEVIIPDFVQSGTNSEQSHALVWTDPPHGSIERLSEAFVYLPGPEFWDEGYDSFHFSYDNYAGTRNTVFLIADLKGSRLLQGAPDECGFGPGWTVIGDPAAYRILNWGESVPTCIFEFLLGHSSPAYLQSPFSLYGPGGGNTSITLDPGGQIHPGDLYLPEGLELPIVAAVTPDDKPVFELLMVDGPELIVRAHQGDGTFISSPPVPIGEDEQRIELNWWFASIEGAADGGITLSRDGQMVAAVQGVDNLDLLYLGWNWRFGLGGESSSASGVIQISDPEVWVSDDQMLFEPLFAESAGSLSLNGWSEVINANRVSISRFGQESDPEFLIRLPSDGVGAGFKDDSPNGETHYRARFAVGLSLVSGSQSGPWTLFSGRGLGQETTLFRIQVRRGATTGSLEIRSQTKVGGELRASAWYLLPSGATRTKIALQWWAAHSDTEGTGGLRLWVDGVPAGEVLNLANPDQHIDETYLGALDIALGMAGFLVVDDFFAWH